MEDFLLSILAGILEALAEVLLEFFLAELVAAVSRLARRFFLSVLQANPLLIFAVLAVSGIGCGFLSLLLFPHPLVHPSRLHGISLIISPLLTGLVMSEVGRWLIRRGRRPVAVESFRYGFVFAFGLELVRLFLAK